jgi:hypothetical protein
MTAPEWINMLSLIPEAEHTKLVIVLKNGMELCVDTLYRFERAFLVMRGRAGGTIDESRGFFVPYDQMMCVRLDRVIKLDDLDAMLTPEAEPVVRTTETPVVTSAQPTPTSAPTDPAAASRLLLERIRAVRASSARSMGMAPSQME